MSAKMPSAVLVEEVEWFLAAGVHPAWVGKALGKSLNAIEKACQRAGRYDLARPFTNELRATGKKAAA